MKKRTYRDGYYVTPDPHEMTKTVKLRRPDLTMWQAMKNYINELKSGETFKRKELLRSVFRTNMASYETSVDQYRVMLCHIKILEHIGHGHYKKLRNIPESLTTQQLKKYAYNKNNWESWFTPLNMLDELTGDKNENSM
ncbi:MAG: hypothetical protein ACFFG0_00860 [Candidatus Thorarchaeota archaeon]